MTHTYPGLVAGRVPLMRCISDRHTPCMHHAATGKWKHDLKWENSQNAVKHIKGPWNDEKYLTGNNCFQPN